ncbi:alpha/beta fold hydrolase [Campylobacter curvus]|uniref:alpha/beta fold hydrolase n=1 Tax=Campylobacter curvus TaxID=200 RepID=UPI0014701D0B|nr:alpha/beta fold hydrolase [Campylobacter curvus]
MQEMKTEFGCVRFSDLPGEKTPIVFIHGWGCAGSFDYTECVSSAALAGHRRVLVDMLGAGYSDKPENFDYLPQSHARYICELVKRLNLGEFIVCGHSLGARAAVAVAENLPHEVKGVILIEGSIEKEFLPYIDEGEAKFVSENREKFIADCTNDEDMRFVASMRQWSAVALWRSANELMSESSGEWARRFYALNQPKIFIAGGASDEGGFDLGAIAKAGIDVLSVPGATHAMIWETPALAAEWIAKAAAKLTKDGL